MADASRDGNMVPTLLGASSVDGSTPVRVYANPDTHRLLVDATTGMTGPGTSTDNAIAVFDGTTGQTLQNSTLIVTGNDLDVPGDLTAGTLAADDGFTGTFAAGSNTVTVVGGIITDVSPT